MERSIAFYRDIMGMKVDLDSAAEGVQFKGAVADMVTGCPGTEQRLVFLRIGDSRTELVQYTPSGKPLQNNKASDTGSAHVCFKTDNIQELYQRLLANKVRLHCAPQHIGFGWVTYFRDPDGVILDAAQDDV